MRALERCVRRGSPSRRRPGARDRGRVHLDHRRARPEPGDPPLPVRRRKGVPAHCDLPRRPDAVDGSARGPSAWSTAAVATDGTAYWSESDPIGTALHATNADGSPKGSVSVANRILGRGGGAAVIDRDGIVYFSAFQGETVAVDPITGSVLWKIDGLYDGGGWNYCTGNWTACVRHWNQHRG